MIALFLQVAAAEEEEEEVVEIVEAEVLVDIVAIVSVLLAMCPLALHPTCMPLSHIFFFLFVT